MNNELLGDPFGITHRLLLHLSRRRGEQPPREPMPSVHPASSEEIQLVFSTLKEWHDREESRHVDCFVKEQQRRAESLVSFYNSLASPVREQSPEFRVHDGENEPAAAATPRNWMSMYQRYRRHQYLSHVTRWEQRLASSAASSSGELHAFYRLMHWCNAQGVFLHPQLRIDRSRSCFRDFSFTIADGVPKYCPLIAIPEELCIGFREESADSNALRDEDREKSFSEASGMDDMDVCKFFFDALGSIVADLLSAVHSPTTDKRFMFAESLQRVRTLLNAPYLSDNVVFGEGETCLADVLLQMIRNYIHGGPMVGKVDRDTLRWAVSVCLSHSTPLAIGNIKSIGIIPVVHLMPHGGSNCNAVVIARSNRRNAGQRMATFFQREFGFDFTSLKASEDLEPRWIYVVTTRDLEAGEEVRIQAMAPVCDKATEAAHMWKLSCGSEPGESVETAKVSALQQATTKWIVTRGSELE